jgi:hypothetical protein
MDDMLRMCDNYSVGGLHVYVCIMWYDAVKVMYTGQIDLKEGCMWHVCMIWSSRGMYVSIFY